jgi:hypothetical protein
MQWADHYSIMIYPHSDVSFKDVSVNVTKNLHAECLPLMVLVTACDLLEGHVWFCCCLANKPFTCYASSFLNARALSLYSISSKEIKRAREKKMPYDFTYFILICKLYKSEKRQTRKKQQQQSGGGDESEIVWSNPEEEIINQVCGTCAML